jgi:hypothetical protein
MKVDALKLPDKHRSRWRALLDIHPSMILIASFVIAGVLYLFDFDFPTRMKGYVLPVQLALGALVIFLTGVFVGERVSVYRLRRLDGVIRETLKSQYAEK